jgi:hypothetical protein
MTRKLTLLLLTLSLLLAPLASPPRPTAAQDDWIPVGPGIDYRAFNIPGLSEDPIHVARMDRSHPDVRLDTMLGRGSLIPWSLEAPSRQAARMDDALTLTGDLYGDDGPSWGERSRVLVAINGSLIDTQTTYKSNGVIDTLAGTPNQGMLMSGWYMDRFQDFQNRSGLAWFANANTFIGGCTEQLNADQEIIFDLEDPVESGVNLAATNVPRTTDRVYLFTPHYGATTRTLAPPGAYNVEVLVQMETPLAILPLSVSNFTDGPAVTGVVRELRVNLPAARIPFDHVVLSAFDAGVSNGASKLNDLVVGQRIGFVQRIIDRPADSCIGNTGNNWTNAHASIGADITFISNGAYIPPVGSGYYVRAPRTAIAYGAQYLYFIVAEGRLVQLDEDIYTRTGISIPNLATFALAYLAGTTHAVNLDGGGSSIMVVDGVVVNRPADFLPLVCTRQYLPMITHPPVPENQARPQSQQDLPALDNEPTPAPEPVSPAGVALVEGEEAYLEVTNHYTWGQEGAGICQRRVVNGIMMVAIEPQQESETYQLGDLIQTARPALVRQGPGDNYPSLGIAAGNQVGFVIDPLNGLAGVYAKGQYWWPVEVGAFRGWIAESDIIPYVFPGGMPGGR